MKDRALCINALKNSSSMYVLVEIRFGYQWGGSQEEGEEGFHVNSGFTCCKQATY